MTRNLITIGVFYGAGYAATLVAAIVGWRRHGAAWRADLKRLVGGLADEAGVEVM